MFPVNDLNFVVCGIATFAATVGYACSRKLASSPTSTVPSNSHDIFGSPNEVLPESAPPTPQGHSPSDQGATHSSGSHLESTEALPNTSISQSFPTRRPSLKRKEMHDEHDDHSGDVYPHNLSSIYPNKRSRTPSSESDSNETLPGEVSMFSEPSAAVPVLETGEASNSPADAYQHDLTIDPIEPSRSTLAKEKNPLLTSPQERLDSTISLPSTRSATASRFEASSSRGFSAFAGSTSSFGSAELKSAFPSTTERPAWRSLGGQKRRPFEGHASPNEAVFENAILGAKEDEHVDKSGGGKACSSKLSPDPLAAEIPSKTTYTHVTGEEDEDVELELKGVKLFVKRGDKNFSDGMIGHIKLLSNKTTLDERLGEFMDFFRREPLWKISMNVRLHPALRCTFDAEENVLRLVLKEPVEQENVPPEEWARDIVVYAVKPGRTSSKQDFREFADALLASPNLKLRT